MEYALGSIITIAVILVTRYFFSRNPLDVPPQVRYSQSHVYNLIAPFMPENSELRKPVESQSSKYLDNITIRVVFLDDKAYWLKDDVFYVADAENQQIRHDTATQVDTMAMDKVQLDKIKFVVEKLTEGNQNDSRNAG